MWLVVVEMRKAKVDVVVKKVTVSVMVNCEWVEGVS